MSVTAAQVLHRPICPSHFPWAVPGKGARLLDRYLTRFPNATAGECDIEDWAENALMQFAIEDAAADAGIAFHLLENEIPKLRLNGAAAHLPPSVPDGIPTVMWGVFCSSDRVHFPHSVRLLGNGQGDVKTVSQWALQDAFVRRAGRDIIPWDFTTESIEAAFAKMQRNGHSHAFIKTAHKEWTAIVSLDEPLPEDIAWSIVQYEGSRNGLIVQSVIKPRNEYRVFVVNGQAVTGAGCIETMTPLDHWGDRFDRRVESIRNRGEVRVDPQLVADYIAYANQFAASWAREVSSSCAYTLDLATCDEHGTIVPIELNPMVNTGLYACDVKALARALVDQVHR